jgi:hypothetical protein
VASKSKRGRAHHGNVGECEKRLKTLRSTESVRTKGEEVSHKLPKDFLETPLKLTKTTGAEKEDR